jgi:SAM-dependent methyltransferase
MIDKIDNNFSFISCPMCGNDKLNVLGEIEYEEKIFFSDIQIELVNIPELARCTSCGTTVVQKCISPDEMKKLYSMGNSSKRWIAKEFFSNKDPAVLKVIQKGIVKDDVVVDVGCNDGISLDELRSKFGVKTIGIEYSESSQAALRQKGHAVYTSLNELPENSANLITAFDLIEHLHDPKAFLKDCHRVLVKGGRLLVVTGNQDSWLARHCANHWWYIRFPEHIVFPSLKGVSDTGLFKVKRTGLIYPHSMYLSDFKTRWNSFRECFRNPKHNAMPIPWGDHMILECTKL